MRPSPAIFALAATVLAMGLAMAFAACIAVAPFEPGGALDGSGEDAAVDTADTSAIGDTGAVDTASDDIADAHDTRDAGPAEVDATDAPCLPQCDTACGPDGCGGTCGTCEPGHVCADDGRCEATVGDSCAAPHVIDPDALPLTWQGTTDDPGLTALFTTSLSCEEGGVVFGAGSRDEVFAFTPAAGGIYTFTLSADFDAMLSVRAGCDESATTCLAAESLLAEDEVLRAHLDAGATYAIVVDGFANEADARGAYTLTVSAPCASTCGARLCGYDGCGGVCGECGDGEACASPGACIPATQLEGNTCVSPFQLDHPPFTVVGDTTFASDEVALDLECGAGYPSLGAGTPDQVWRFDAAGAGVYRARLEATFVASLTAYSVCGVSVTAPLCLNAAAGVGEVELELTLDQGEGVYLVVDGVGPTAASRGAYTLSVSESCQPACDGRVCGPDGCGGACGQCALDAACALDAGACAAPDLVAGSVCANPAAIGELPATLAGSTLNHSADYAVPDGACPGVSGALGGASRDAAYAFTAPAAGDYRVNLEASFDSALYVVADCDAIAASCLAAVDAVGLAAEELLLTLAAGELVYIIVDGFSNLGGVGGDYVLRVDGPL